MKLNDIFLKYENVIEDQHLGWVAEKTLTDIVQSPHFRKNDLKKMHVHFGWIRTSQKRPIHGTCDWINPLEPKITILVNTTMNSCTEADLQFTIWHEFGHAMDRFNGTLTNSKDAIYYNGTTVPVDDIVKIMNGDQSTREKTINLHKIYANMPHEAAANSFAYQACVKTNAVPADYLLKICYEVGENTYREPKFNF